MSKIPVDSPPSRRFNWRTTLDVAASIAMILTAGVVVWHVLVRLGTPVSSRPPISVPTMPIVLEGVPTLGTAGARVAMVVFSDFECPYCASLATDIIPPLKRRYVDSGKVRVAFRHLPLPNHARAIRAAESAECAARQGKFWAMHDSLFQPPMRLGESELETHAREAGLDTVAFAGCMTGAAADRVTADLAIARDLGLMATPSIIVGVETADGTIRAVEVITGARPVKEFEKALDRALSRAGKH